MTAADLTQVNLSGALVSGLNFAGANLGGTIFGEIDLVEAKGLLYAVHLYPSVLGTDTLRNSCGKLPTAFLRGCGLDDIEIEASKLHNRHMDVSEVHQVLKRMSELYVRRPSQYFSCFISYSHADAEFARKLHERLQERGIRVWLDEKQLLPGDDIYEQVDRGISQWDKVLLCCSEHSLSSWWVDNEISAAFAKEQKIMKERGRKTLALIPLNLDNYLFSWNNGKAQQVLTRLAADFTSWPHETSTFEEEIEKIIRALRADAGSRESPPEMML